MKVNRPVYLLILLIEECAEIIHRSCKAIRFGMEEVQPGQELNNKTRLQMEMLNHAVVTELLLQEGIIRPFGMPSEIDAKRVKIQKYMLYSQKCGILELDHPNCKHNRVYTKVCADCGIKL